MHNFRTICSISFVTFHKHLIMSLHVIVYGSYNRICFIRGISQNEIDYFELPSISISNNAEYTLLINGYQLSLFLPFVNHITHLKEWEHRAINFCVTWFFLDTYLRVKFHSKRQNWARLWKRMENFYSFRMRFLFVWHSFQKNEISFSKRVKICQKKWIFSRVKIFLFFFKD